jgi:hypothetical protein
MHRQNLLGFHANSLRAFFQPFALSLMALGSLGLGIMAAAPANAAPRWYQFNWSGNPAMDWSITNTTDPSLKATGVLQIDAAPGSVFTSENISGVSIDVFGDTILPFHIDQWSVNSFLRSPINSAGGIISSDGRTAEFKSDFNVFYRDTPSDTFFGCEKPFCQTGSILIKNGFDLAGVTYRNRFDALISMQLEAIPEERAPDVPGPLPLLAAGTAFGWSRRLRRHQLHRATSASLASA